MKDTATRVIRPECKSLRDMRLQYRRTSFFAMRIAILLMIITPDHCSSSDLSVDCAPSQDDVLSTILESDLVDASMINPLEIISVCTKTLHAEPKLHHALLLRVYRCRAKAYIATKRFDLARMDYLQLLKLKPDDPDIECQYADLLLTLGKQDEATQEVTSVLKQYPRHASANALAAQISLAKKDINSCIQYATRAIEADDSFAMPYYTRAIANLLQGSSRCSLKDVSRFIELQPLSFNSNSDSDGSPYLLRASVLIQLNQPKRALQDLRMARTLGADSFSILHETWSAYYAMKKYQMACYSAKKMIDLDNKNPEAFWSHAAALAKLGRLQEALKASNKAHELDPKNGRIYFQLGSICALLGDYGQALEYYEKNASMSPNWIDGRKAQILIYAACPDEKYRNRDKARKLAAKLFHNRGEDDPESHLLMSMVHAEFGAIDQALDSLAKAIRLAQPDSSVQHICNNCKTQFKKNNPFRLSHNNIECLFPPLPR